MSDMPRPGLPPSAAAHAQHDPLLVAQLAAADPLDEEREREAQALVRECQACSRLAADLRAVSNAVAWEPVPPRRRDFRIEAEQAQELRGGAITRFLRGLPLPRSGAFRPAAAGLLSVGLVFVVAGSIWPGDDGLTVDGETNAVPTMMEAPAPSSGLDFEDVLRSQAGSPVEELEVDLEALEQYGDEVASEASERREAQKSVAERPEADLADDADDAWLEGAAGATPPEPDSVVGGEIAPELGAAVADGTERLMVEEAEVTAATAAAGQEEAAVAAIAEASGDVALETMLVAAGATLALLGVALLLLAWLSRRVTDPLLR